MNCSHVDVYRLFRKAPDKWSPEDLTGLHIEQQNEHTPIVDIVDCDISQPKDERRVSFETLTKAFTQPTREQVIAGTGPASIRDRHNPFQRAFNDLRRATDAFGLGSSVQRDLDGIASEFVLSSRSRDMYVCVYVRLRRPVCFGNR